MEAPFRMRLRKGEGISKKGPLIAKHPPSPPSTIVAGTPVGQPQQAKELRSPVSNGPPSLLSHRRRPLSPDPRAPNSNPPASSRRTHTKTDENSSRKSPKTSPSRHPLHHSEKPKSPSAPRRYMSRGPIYGNMRNNTGAKSQTPQSPTSPTPRRSPPNSPLIRRPFTPIVPPKNREEMQNKTRAPGTAPMKAFHPTIKNPPSLNTTPNHHVIPHASTLKYISPNSTINQRISHHSKSSSYSTINNHVTPHNTPKTPSPNSTISHHITSSKGPSNTSTLTGTRRMSVTSCSYRPSSPRGSSPRGTHSRGTSPKGTSSRGSSPRGRGSSPGAKVPLISEETLRVRVKRVYKERLYLLHQPGPNSFSVGLDSAKHKYKVIIGPQSCSCGHGPFCIHVLFIMVRVLQVSEKNPLLSAGSLKDFEVEQLLRGWEERRKTAIRSRERRVFGLLDTKERLPFLFPLKDSADAGQLSTGANSEACSSEFDNQCPICLMTMVEGEHLVACETGCRNCLHHHCMAVWASDRHSQNQPLLCPLCRAPWPSENDIRSHNGPIRPHRANQDQYAYHGGAGLSGRASGNQHKGAGQTHDPNLPNNPYVNTHHMSASFSGLTSPLRANSPAMSRSLSSGWPNPPSPMYNGGYNNENSPWSNPSPGKDVPYPNYPPTVRAEISDAFVHSAAEELVPLPHSEPIPAEHEQTAVAWVNVFGRELIACLFSRDWVVRETGLRRLSHEVVKVLRWDCMVRSEQNQQKVVTCCANILAQVANDPVYKIYLACLRCVRVLLAHLSPFESKEVLKLQGLFRPLLHTLLLKCADGNRRTSQISVDSLIELCRGQIGELALGTHSVQVNFGGQGMQECLGLGGITFVLSCILDDNPPTEAPWQWLLGRLCILDKLLDEFPHQFQLQVVQSSSDESGYKLQHYNRLLTVVEFAFKALGSSHTTVAKLARRIYICGARMSAAEPAVFNQVCDMLGKLDVSLQMRLKRRLRGTTGNGHGERKGSLAKLGDMFPLGEQGTRLVRSVSHSPSRMFSAFRSSSQSPARHLSKAFSSRHKLDKEKLLPSHEENSQITTNSSKNLKFTMDKRHNIVLLPDKKTISKIGVAPPAIFEKSKQSPPRPTHLPLDSLDLKFREKQAKLRLYHKAKARQELPLIVQEAIISPTRDNYTAMKSKGGNFKKLPGLSQSYGDNLDVSPPQSPINALLSKAAPSLLKDVLTTPGTPNAPFCTPVNHKFVTLGPNLFVQEHPLPVIPGLDFIPPYLGENVDSTEKDIESQPYDEGCDWIKGPLLGTGAFSSCYQARDVATGTLMAVKQVSICRNSEEDQERVEAAVEEEVLLMCKLRHPHIIRMIGATRLATSFSVFTEWMAGGSVGGMLDKYGAFSEHVIVKYTRQILDGLAYLHDNMILHRDLKGANLLVDSTGQWLRIGDFGTAARLASKATITDEFRGQLLGTIAFMAPEVLRGDNYGRACDVWSVGCCVLEMATTKPPWGAENVSNQYKLMFRIASSNGPPDVPQCLSDETRDMALQCLQIKSDHRPTTKELLKHPVFHNMPP